MMTMSILQQGLPPPYTDPQTMVAASEASMQQSFLTLTGQDSMAATTVHTELVQPIADLGENQETFKQNIYKHPLFPLLALMFEKCESATASPDTASNGFENELEAFAKHHDDFKTPVLGADEEVNELMLKSIQVLRIHLMEVEKVTELCRDFCSRYISCLKSKLTSESLLHVEGCDSPPPGELNGAQGLLNLSPALQIQQPVVAAPAVVGGGVMLQQQQQQQQPQPQQPQIVSGNTVYQMVHTPQGIVAQPIQIQGPLTPIGQTVPQVIHGSTPLSQIGLSLASPQQQQPQQQLQQAQQLPTQQTAVPTAIAPPLQHMQKEAKNTSKLNNILQDDVDDDDKNSKQKRGVLPKQATQIMKSWLFQHIVHPYPTEDEKRQIATQTNLTLLQVNNWFINARRRILQPMLEASNPDKAKAKKVNKPTNNKPQQRFWPIPLDSSANENAEKSENEGSGEGLKIKPEISASAPSPAAASASSSTAIQKAVNERLQSAVTMDTIAATQSDGMMSYLSNGGLVLKLSPEGHLIPNTQMALPAANPATISLESLQALQSSGLVFAPGPTHLPLHLPLGTLPSTAAAAAAGLGLGMTPFPTLAAAAAVSPMSIGGLNFGTPAFSTPLQFANLNAAPIDLSTMSSAGHLQMGIMAPAHPAPQHMTNANGQVLMSVSIPDRGHETSMEDGESEPEAGELRVDTRDVRPALDMSKT